MDGAIAFGWMASPGDIMRYWWGLLYWNARKSIFRLQGDKARCPCQNPSDSGRALETVCDATQDWRQPARFRRVCPLLVDTPAGLRCSVDARDVRPFWARAAASYLRATAGVGVAGALILFVVLRLAGYPLLPLALIWPPRWHEIRLARSDFFVAKARRALDAHQVSEAIVSLDLAYRDNPRNYDAGIRLAQLTSIGRPEFADKVFATLIRDFPDRRAAASEAWLRSLLINGNFARVAELAASRLVDDAPRRPAWLHALFNATRQCGSDQPLRDLVKRQSARLEPIDVALINSELLIRQGRGLELLPGLTTELPLSAGAYAPFFQVSRLDELGRHAEALALLDQYAAARRLAQADEFQLRLGIEAELGRQNLLRKRLAQAPINARELELISIHLVRHPDPAAVVALGACLQRSTLRPDDSTYSGCTAFLVACGVSHEWNQMHAAAGVLQQIAETRPGRFAIIEAFFRQEKGARIEAILPLLPGSSFDLIYALYDRYDGRPAVVTSPTTPAS
jgi:hypothetical protein